MMKKISVLVAAGLLVAGLPVVAAESTDMYGGVSYSLTTYNEDGFSSVKPKTVSITLGKQLSPNFAVEARAGTGREGDSIHDSGVRLIFNVDNYYGLYARGILPLTERLSVYGLAGLTHASATASASGGGVTVSDTGADNSFSYGIGADFSVTDTAVVNVEFARLLQKSDYTLDAMSFGVKFKF